MSDPERRLREATLLGGICGLGVLSIVAAVLFGLGIAGAVVDAGSPIGGALLFVATVGILTAARYEWTVLGTVADQIPVGLARAERSVLAILGGTVVTLGLAVEPGLSPIVAAAVVGVVAAVLLPGYAVPVYCGAFVGMTSPALFSTYWHALVAGAVASAVFLAAQPVYHGIGGKLGTTAFVGVLATVAATSGRFLSGPLPALETLVLGVGFATVAATVTFWLHRELPVTPVLASGLVGVVGGAGLPFLFGSSGDLLAAAVFSASFAGMTDPRRIPHLGWIGLAGAFVGLAVVYTTPYLGGSGGKLGTIAFGSVLAVHAFLRSIDAVRIRKRHGQRKRDTT
ncbi:hypothetical protein RH858_00535 [Halalkaliarchaeum sp. AArc-GB]|uniref:hypothetical protein n=1 Tax=unclassified Halalkaliarchaeum TaxID=2678344 RepID=UPI00217E4331|nr:MULTISPECIES: hypothetical protein [unclassified Halalkaliarchaeum]MDR5671642.1 hypothetical protein [Halalkaliarchaeum sp. AArc-GB]